VIHLPSFQPIKSSPRNSITQQESPVSRGWPTVAAYADEGPIPTLYKLELLPKCQEYWILDGVGLALKSDKELDSGIRTAPLNMITLQYFMLSQIADGKLDIQGPVAKNLNSSMKPWFVSA
jgi:hypothetical protein